VVRGEKLDVEALRGTIESLGYGVKVTTEIV
jgi:hypothetical protein